MAYPPSAHYIDGIAAGDWLIRLTSTRKTIDIAPLDQVGWLAEQADELRDWFASAGRWKKLEAGQIMYQAGDVADGIYGLASGTLDIALPLVGGELVTIHRAEPGFWIGDSAQLSKRPRMISISAATPCKVLRVPGADLERLLTENPQFWPSIYDLNHRNVETALTLLGESLALTVKARVCRRLLALAEHEAEVTITQDDLAKLVGVTRATVRRAIAELAAEGGVETGYRSLHLSDLAVLRRHKDEQ